jgi:hypothetical protein
VREKELCTVLLLLLYFDCLFNYARGRVPCFLLHQATLALTCICSDGREYASCVYVCVCVKSGSHFFKFFEREVDGKPE